MATALAASPRGWGGRLAWRLVDAVLACGLISAMFAIRPVEPADFAAWKPLWDGYNAYYGRQGPSALPDAVTQATWQRFFDPVEPQIGRAHV